MPGPSPANEKHFGVGVVNSAHWLLAPVSLDRRSIDALRPISVEGSALYLEGQQLAQSLRNELTSLVEWTGTVVPPGVGWPEDWYFSYRLRRPAEALEILAKHIEAKPPSLADRAWVFADNAPLWEWHRSRSELLLSGDLTSRRVTRVALALDQTPIHREPAA